MNAVEGGRPLLAIEMSQRGGSVALGLQGATPRVERFDAGGERDSDPLIPVIDRLVREMGFGPGELGAVAVSIGPGGFTGLRISVTAAKCMAEALGIPLLAVPSALVAAASATGPGDWLVALAAKRDSVWLTTVTGDAENLAITGVPRVVRAVEVVLPANSRTLLADAYAPAGLVDLCRSRGLIVEEPRFDAAACWRLAIRRWQRGLVEDPLQLAPLYPREPEAATLWRQRHGSTEPDIGAPPA